MEGFSFTENERPWFGPQQTRSNVCVFVSPDVRFPREADSGRVPVPAHRTLGEPEWGGPTYNL